MNDPYFDFLAWECKVADRRRRLVLKHMIEGFEKQERERKEREEKEKMENTKNNTEDFKNGIGVILDLPDVDSINGLLYELGKFKIKDCVPSYVTLNFKYENLKKLIAHAENVKSDI